MQFVKYKLLMLLEFVIIKVILMYFKSHFLGSFLMAEETLLQLGPNTMIKSR